jgi:hypothetical protein
MSDVSRESGSSSLACTRNRNEQHADPGTPIDANRHLKSLAKRVEALENVIATKESDQSRKDWRKVVGMFGDSEFIRKVDDECMGVREAEREAARRGEPPE